MEVNEKGVRRVGRRVVASQQKKKKPGQRHGELAEGLENTFAKINFLFRAAPDQVFSQLRLMQFGETERLKLGRNSRSFSHKTT